MNSEVILVPIRFQVEFVEYMHIQIHRLRNLRPIALFTMSA